MADDDYRGTAALVLPAGEGPVRLTRLDLNPATPGRALESLTAAVGGYVEALTLSPGARAYLNEDGKTLELAVNPAANWLVRALDVGLAPWDVVVGPVVVLGTVDPDGHEDGYEHDVPDSLVDLFRANGAVVEVD